MMNAVRDCNNCRHHVQGLGAWENTTPGPRSDKCKACQALTDKGHGWLPLWDPLDSEPYTVDSENNCACQPDVAMSFENAKLLLEYYRGLVTELRQTINDLRAETSRLKAVTFKEPDTWLG